jgi:HSP20 family protein
MNFNFDSKEFAKQSNLLNTINGGIVNTYIEISHKENKIVIKVNVPGIHYDAFNIILSQNKIIVHELCDRETALTLGAKKEFFPSPTMFNRVFDVPPFVESDKIFAELVENKLHIVMLYKNQEQLKPN